MPAITVDPNTFIDNLNQHWADAFARYPNEHVAWSLDGRTILAHSSSVDGLISELERLGIQEFVADYLTPGDEILPVQPSDVSSVVAAETHSGVEA